jgi:hypothetical protein
LKLFVTSAMLDDADERFHQVAVFLLVDDLIATQL